MFFSARMKKINVLVLAADEPQVTEAVGGMGVLHLTSAPADTGALPSAGPALQEKETRIEALKSRVDKLCESLAVETVQAPESAAHATVDEIEQELARIEADVSGPIAERTRLVTEGQEAEQLIRDTAFLCGKIDIPVEQLRNLGFLHVAVGALPSPEAIAAAEAELGDRAVLIPFPGTDHEQKVIAVSTRTGRWAMESTLEKHGFVRLHIPDDQQGLPEQVAERAEQRLSNIIRQKESVDRAIREAVERDGDRLLALRRRLHVEHQIIKARQKYSQTHATRMITGWVPADNAGTLGETVLALTRQTAIVDVRDPEPGEDPPSRFRNPPLVRAFELLVKTFTLPRYNEIEPTPIFTLLFIIMFGVMFGDVGQSGLLLIAGILAWRKGKRAIRDMGIILTLCSISGIVFGAVEGSVFGYEVGGEHSIFFRPIENAQLTLAITVLFGVAVISLGLVLNIINRIRRREYANLLLHRFGLVGGLFYWGSLAMLVRGLSGHAVSSTAIALIVIVPLVLIFVRHPAAAIIARIRGHQGHGDGLGMIVTESGAEVFETVLAFVANTLSFARIGAFALAHAGLCLVMQQLMHVAGGAWSPIILVLGTLLIVLLEGFIVAIQSLRLQYYEFFNKFLQGEGREYQPFAFKV